MSMKSTLCIMAFVLFFSKIYAQNQDSLSDMYQHKKYDEIIQLFASKKDSLSSKQVYYVGLAYYMKSQDEDCLSCMKLAIQKDSLNADAYYITGMTRNYMGQYNLAISQFEKAIRIDTDNPHYYIGLGDSYLQKKMYEKALDSYTKATKSSIHVDRPYIAIAQIYAELNKLDKALEAFYLAKDKVSKNFASYINVLYNIGLYEYLSGNLEKAEKSLIELTEKVPNDYQATSKLIQVYYAQKDYNKAIPLKNKLYEAYRKNKLPKNLKDMFCFDQFKWKDKRILAFERYKEVKGKLYYKHLFYVQNSDGKIEYRIQTENSPVSEELTGTPKYAVGMNKGNAHYTFLFIPKDFLYDDLKTIVLNIITDKIKPTSSSTYSK